MALRNRRFHPALSSAVLAVLSACGGGGGDSTPVVTTPAPTTTNVSTTVIDGAILNAVVCVDKNSNGKCDTDETQGTTDASGNVTLAVPNGDVGKYPILAVVGTNAVDADHGPITTAYTMSAPADQAAVVSPLTTLVQQTVASTGVTTVEAAQSVQAATGITASLFQDFTKVAAPTDGSVSAATVARMVVVTTQQQATAIASTLGTTAIDGATISQTDLDKAIQKKLLELLPSLVTALSDPAVLAATTAAGKEAALLAAASGLITSAGLTPAAVATVVAINTQGATSTPVTTVAPAPGLSLDNLTFTNATNYSFRTLGSSTVQNTPDSSNNVKYVERRTRSNNGAVARWGSGGDPARNADLNWNGTAWVGCPINFENTSSVRDALGNSVYTYCDGRETGKSSRATFDIAGKTMAEVYGQIRAAGYTNVFIADATALGSATFPANSKLFYQTNTPLTEAFSYYPAGAGNAAGTSNAVSQYSAAVAAGGVASTQAAGVGCNASETNGNGTNSTTLESMIAAKAGTPCVYGQGTLTYNGVTYQSDAANEWWGNSTVNLGIVGTVPVATSSTSTGYYTGNTLLRVAFTGSGTNPVTYYGCKQRYVNGSPRNCTVIGTGSYTITTLGDGRVMTLTNPPLQAASLTYNRVLVERGGAVYLGYQSKPTVTNRARMNLTATNALLTQLGLTPDDPSVPLALTATSYQGTWDVRAATDPNSATVGATFFVNGNGTTSCQDRSNSTFFNCSVSITNPATGAFTFANLVNGNTATGNLNFMSGSISGTLHDVSTTPATDEVIVGARR